jgi:N-acyl-D-amino-acid deacylase
MPDRRRVQFPDVSFDLLIRNGTVVDGTGGPSRPADVGMDGGFVRAVGDLSSAVAERKIDATGLTVTPGFVDTHTHSEGVLLTDPQHACGLRQGITTEVVALDGVSYAPLSPSNYRLYRRYLAGLLGDPPEDLDTTTVAAFRNAFHKRVAVNVAYLVPHGALRLEALGFHDRPLTGDALVQAGRLLREGIEHGAVGLSSGLNYYPCAWCDTNELVELANFVRQAGGVHVIELRYRGSGRADPDGGVEEALEVGRRSRARMHLAHYRTHPHTAGKVDALMAPVDAAQADGVDVSFDIYPYATGSSYPLSYLPGWAQEGGPDAILARLADPTDRARIIQYLDHEHDRLGGNSLSGIVFSYAPGNPSLEGVPLREVAEARGQSLGATLCDVLLAEELRVGYCLALPTSMARWRQVSRDAVALLARPDAMACSDITPLGSMCHPRSFGAYPRFLGRFRREFGGMSLETMVQRMTDAPARRFGLTRRGRIEPGYHADVTVFDAERIIDTATYEDPRQEPAGIPYVIVNGKVAVDNERCTGVLAGEAVP